MQYSPHMSAEANATRALVRRIVVIGYHLLLWAFAFQLAMALRFEGDVPRPWSTRRWPVLGILIGLRLVTFYRAGLFHGLWRYAGMPELKNLAWASTLPTLLVFALGMGADGFRMPLGTYLGEWLASIVLVGGSRFVIRIFREHSTSTGGKPRPDALRTLIVGAGDAGDSLLRDMQRAPDSKWI
ncbi:MAG: nucleoside-diphosphate sugar epimerase/dehydratase, partial [Byssovorax sp.]